MGGVQERVKKTAERAADTATAAREKSRAVAVAFATWERDRRSVGNVLAGAVAFRLFLYLLPLVLVAVAVLGSLVALDPDTPEDLGKSLGMSNYLITSVGNAADESHKSLWVLIPLATILTLSAGAAMAKVLHAATQLAWGQPVSKLKRPVGGAAVAFACTLVAVAVVAIDNIISSHSIAAAIVFAVAAGFVFFGMWLGVSLLMPHADAPWTALIPGAIWVATGVQALHLVSVFWLGNKIQSSSELYGPLGAGAALLGFLYVFGRLIVGSAMLNATLYERRERRKAA